MIRALYDRYRRPLFGYVLRSVGGDHQYAEDIVQETMARAWAHSAELDPDRAGRWLFTVARNLVISGRRKRAARVTEVTIDAVSFRRSATTSTGCCRHGRWPRFCAVSATTTGR